jgi:hypothetical protein
MWYFLNVLFFVIHTVWMLFNCCGWAWRRTRRWHLATVGLTALSWFVLGYWYGWGYCVCTDWHWQVRNRLGLPYDPSYTHLLFQELTGIDVAPWLSDAVTAGVFALVTVLSLVLNGRDYLRWRRRVRKLGRELASLS